MLLAPGRQDSRHHHPSWQLILKHNFIILTSSQLGEDDDEQNVNTA